MKNLLPIVFLFVGIVIVTLTACDKDEAAPPPVASFMMDKTKGLAPCTIYFTNQSTNATSYQWNFGDGGVSALQNVYYEYTSSGNFTVTLTATGEGGTNTISQNVTIEPSLTGQWEKTFYLQGTEYNGTMNLTQNENNKIMGDFVFSDGSGYTSLLSTSSVNGSSVTIEWMLSTYRMKFEGFANGNFTYLSGNYYVDGQYKDQWSATKSSKMKAIGNSDGNDITKHDCFLKDIGQIKE